MYSPALSGVFRSLRQYYGDKDRMARMQRLYRHYVQPGDLAFDVGAHVGDRIGAFRELGARVVALEPQPLLMRAVRLIHGHDPQVKLMAAACGGREGHIDLRVNVANPTVTTASADFIKASKGAAGWEDQVWEETLAVPCTTLDRLIRDHGVPAFAKIDVEGFELEVLQGLSKPLGALSFEFTTIQRDVAIASLERLNSLGTYEFNVSLGESHVLDLPEPVTAEAMAEYLEGLPHEANSGDVYAVARR